MLSLKVLAVLSIAAFGAGQSLFADFTPGGGFSYGPAKNADARGPHKNGGRKAIALRQAAAFLTTKNPNAGVKRNAVRKQAKFK